MVIDLFMIYQFLKRLVKPFREWDAYKEGVIDQQGKIIVKKRNRSTSQKKAFTKFDLLVLRLKRLLEKVPGGRTKLGSFAAALALIKEGEELHDADDQTLQETVDRYINLIEEGGAPVNNVGGGEIAGTDKPPISKKKQRKIRQSNQPRNRSHANTDHKEANNMVLVANE